MTMIYNSDLIGKKLSVVDEILLLNPHQTPTLTMLGGFGESVHAIEHQWYEDEMFASESNVVGAKLAADTAIVVLDTEAFRPQQVVKVGEEFVLVTAVNTATKTLTVVRGYAGTTAAAIADGARIEVMFVEGAEGADARAGRYKPRKRVSNITQIFDDAIKISRTAQAVAQYGISNLYEYEKQKIQLMKALELEKAVINGVYYENGETRQMRGIRSFIQTNVLPANGANVSDTHLLSLAQSSYDTGGFKEGGTFKYIAPAKQKLKISNFNSDKIRVEQSQDAHGRVINWIVNDFGRFEVVMNDNLDNDEIMFVDASRIKIRPLVGGEFFHKYLGEDGDYTRGMIVGEYTLEFLQEKAHSRIKGLA